MREPGGRARGRRAGSNPGLARVMHSESPAASRVESPLVGHGLTMFEVPPKQSQVQRPTMTRRSEMRVGLGPAPMGEVNLRASVRWLQFKADDRARPVTVGLGELQLKEFARSTRPNDGSPGIARPEV